MNRSITLNAPDLAPARPRGGSAISLGISMAELCGGAPVPTEATDDAEGALAGALPEERAPLDLTDPRLAALARALSPAWLHIGGASSLTTYYDHDDRTRGVPPRGYGAVLARGRWEAALGFAREVGARVALAMPTVPGLGNAACRALGGTGAWDPAQVRRLLNASTHMGVPVGAVELAAAPEALVAAHPEYGAAHLAQDADALFRMMRMEFPDVLLVGPGTRADEAGLALAGRIAHAMDVPPEAISYRVLPIARPVERRWPSDTSGDDAGDMQSVEGERDVEDASEEGCGSGGDGQSGAGPTPTDDVDPDTTARLPLIESLEARVPGLTESALKGAARAQRAVRALRDAWRPGAPLWAIGELESGRSEGPDAAFDDALVLACGLGAPSRDGVAFFPLTDGPASLLDPETLRPRPTWWLLWLWRELAGDAAFPAHAATVEPMPPAGVHACVSTRGDGHPGFCHLVVNASGTDALSTALPGPALRFTLTGRGEATLLNGEPLELAGGQPPTVAPLGAREPTGTIELPPASVTFLLMGRS